MAAGTDLNRLAEEVIRRRNQLSIKTQAELARRMKMHTKTVSRIESGHSVWAQTYIALQDALEWPTGTVRAILRGDEPTPKTTSPALAVAPPDVNPFARPGERKIYDLLRRKGYSHEVAVDAILDLRREYEREKLLS